MKNQVLKELDTLHEMAQQAAKRTKMAVSCLHLLMHNRDTGVSWTC